MPLNSHIWHNKQNSLSHSIRAEHDKTQIEIKKTKTKTKTCNANTVSTTSGLVLFTVRNKGQTTQK